MSWSERQRRMLSAMGVRLWSPAAAPAAPAVAQSDVATLAVERPVQAVEPAPVAPARAPAAAPASEGARPPAADRKSVV